MESLIESIFSRLVGHTVFGSIYLPILLSECLISLNEQNRFPTDFAHPIYVTYVARRLFFGFGFSGIKSFWYLQRDLVHIFVLMRCWSIHRIELSILVCCIFFLGVLQEAQVYAEDNGLLFMETSAKTAKNVNEIFLAIGVCILICLISQIYYRVIL